MYRALAFFFGWIGPGREKGGGIFGLIGFLGGL